MCTYISVIAQPLSVKHVAFRINSQNGFIMCDKAVFFMSVDRYRRKK